MDERVLNGVDIEGCLTPGYARSPDPRAILVLNEYVNRGSRPYLFLCTSASVEYAEAMAQYLIGMDVARKIEQPLHVCENGAALFDPKTWKVEVNPYVDMRSRNDVKKLEELVLEHVAFSYSVPRAVISSIKADDRTSEELCNIARQLAEENNLKNVGISHSASTLDITPFSVRRERITKWEAILYVCREFEERIKLDIDPRKHVGYIGDSNNDISVLGRVRYPHCPSNASEIVKKVVDRRGGRVSEQPHIHAVLEMFPDPDNPDQNLSDKYRRLFP